MALIKCSECQKEVSTLAKTCPHCGAPVNQETKEVVETSELKKVSIIKEKCKVSTIILPLLVSIAMLIAFIAFDLKGYYLIEQRVIKYELIDCLTRRFFAKEILMFYGSIGIITFISYFLTIISKKTNIIAKIGYIINIILQIAFFITAFDNDLRIGMQFYVIFILNIILFLLPRFDKIISEENLVTKEKKEKIEKRNKSLEKLYLKKRFSLSNIIIVTTTLLVSFFSLLFIYNKNFEKVPPYEQRNPKDLTQFKVTIDYIAVREEPTANSELVGRIFRGDIYNIKEVIDEKNSDYIWYKIEYENNTAYVGSDKDNPYIKVLSPEEDE